MRSAAAEAETAKSLKVLKRLKFIDSSAPDGGGGGGGGPDSSLPDPMEFPLPKL